MTNSTTQTGLTVNTTEEKLTFVLIHGAWAKASFWDNTAAVLREAGHTVYAPEYAGHGDNIDPHVTHEQIVSSVVDYITQENIQDFVLVGHSFGGTVIAKVAEFVSDRVKRLVFFDAFIPKDGESLLDQMPAPVQQAFHGLIQASGNNTITLPFPLFRDTFVNRANLELAKQIYEASPAEPAGPLLHKLDLKKFYSLQIPKSYLFLTEDVAYPPAPFAFHPGQSSNLGVYRLIVSDGDHISTAYTHANVLAQKLVEAGRD